MRAVRKKLYTKWREQRRGGNGDDGGNDEDDGTQTTWTVKAWRKRVGETTKKRMLLTAFI